MNRTYNNIDVKRLVNAMTRAGNEINKLNFDNAKEVSIANEMIDDMQDGVIRFIYKDAMSILYADRFDTEVFNDEKEVSIAND
tara:strand:+ start:2495 stop:2743 length:249 start_codon:yes stop_codon:yes gene_type:complete